MNTEFTKRWMNTRVSQTYDALVIGGGAAGMLAAGTAAARGPAWWKRMHGPAGN